MGQYLSSVGGNGAPAPNKLKLEEQLTEFPAHAFDHADSLEVLDLSGTGLSSLPPDMNRFQKLKIAFFSDCKFTTFPRELAGCPQLEMVAFRGNGMTQVPEDALPPRLRWLILTNNRIEALPRSIGNCDRLEKCMLSGNLLTSLPNEMAKCQKLGLLRLSANQISQLPQWLVEMPQLAFLSFGGNPCLEAAQDADDASSSKDKLLDVAWDELKVDQLIGEGASGTISKAFYGADRPQTVAIKLFKGDLTSDGTPMDEMQACLRVGSHPSLLGPLGRIRGHPDKEGIVMPLILDRFHALGFPPSMQSCIRDCFPSTAQLTVRQGLRILTDIAAASQHLHARGVSHGDLYAHNILYDDSGRSLLGDFGAASIYGGLAQTELRERIEKLEVLAYAHLIEDMLNLIGQSPRTHNDGWGLASLALSSLHRKCSSPTVSLRLTFAEVSQKLSRVPKKVDAWLAAGSPDLTGASQHKEQASN